MTDAERALKAEIKKYKSTCEMWRRTLADKLDVPISDYDPLTFVTVAVGRIDVLETEVAELRKEIEYLTNEVEEEHASAHLRMSADDRARAMWQEKTGREDVIAETRKRTEKPDFKTFVDLKHGIVGSVLWALQNGEISRGRAAECLAEVAHGITEVRLPPTPDAIPEDAIPLDLYRDNVGLREQVRVLREALESASIAIQYWLAFMKVERDSGKSGAETLFAAVDRAQAALAATAPKEEK